MGERTIENITNSESDSSKESSAETENTEAAETPETSVEGETSDKAEYDDNERVVEEEGVLESPEQKLDTQKEEIARAEEMGVDDLSNAEKGNYGEMKTDVYMAENGYERISNDAVTSLNEKGHRGIDGVYECKDGNSDKSQYIIGESKYGSSNLTENADGTKQMDREWIYDSERLDDAVGPEKAEEIRDMKDEDPDNVKSVLSRIDSDGNVELYELDDDGNIIKDKEVF